MSVTEQSPAWTGKIFTGTWADSESGATLDITAPATGEVIASVGSATPADLDAAVTAAQQAQPGWAALPYDQRAKVFRTAAQLLEANPDRLAGWLVQEAGSGAGKAGFEVFLVIGELQQAAALAGEPYGELLRSFKPRLSLARRVPLGVVGAISPFNFPAVLSMRTVAPALALGNAVVLKPDPRTPVSGGLALAELLAEAGLPEGLLHVLPGGADVGAALVQHPGLPCISFTGSTAAGRAIATAAGPLLKKVHLELGGNNALLILPDADLDAAVSAGAWASFLHQGQICMTAGRHLVPRDLVDEYVSKLAVKARHIPVGDPADPANALGPVIDETQRDKVHDIVTRSAEQGARVAAGGSYDGLFYQPTVLTDVPLDSPAYAEEIFGPVAPVVAYDSVDEAIDLINASAYGLSVAILTSDPFAAIELAGRIRSGAIHINDQTVDDEATAPFGGVKASGTGGRFGGTASLDTFTEVQWITAQGQIERYPF